MFRVVPVNGKTWLICGGRTFADEDMFDSAMGDLMSMYGCPSRIVHGGAFGADKMAAAFAKRMSIDVLDFPPNWGKHGRAAGPIRNQEMLDKGKPALVVAFPGGRGTADMVRRAMDAGIDVTEIKPEPSHD